MRLRILMSAATCMLVAACSADNSVTPLERSNATVFAKAGDITADVAAAGNAVNAQLEAEGAEYRLYQEEWLTDGDVNESSNTYFWANVGNKRLGADFVPGDPRRGGRTNITYWVNEAGGNTGALTAAQTTAAIDRAMSTWDNVTCSDI